MKNWSLLLMSLFFANLLSAQADISERQIGLDATAFITRFLSFNAASTGTSNPEILFLYRKEKDGKHLRYGIGGRFNLETTKNNDLKRRNSITRLDFKFGREYRKGFSKRWRTYYGWDALIGVFQSSTKNTNLNSDESVTDFSRGATIRVNPLVGIQFFLNERLSFSTEMAYGLQFNLQQLGNDTVVSNRRYSVETFYAPPINLVLNYKI